MRTELIGWRSGAFRTLLRMDSRQDRDESRTIHIARPDREVVRREATVQFMGHDEEFRNRGSRYCTDQKTDKEVR